jgi:hypothetical protein
MAKKDTWYSTPRSLRKRRGMEFMLSPRLRERLQELKADGANLSALAERGLRALPEVGLPPEEEDEESTEGT